MVKIWFGVAVLVLLLANCATMPKRPENLAQDDYSFTREYISWLIKNEMKARNVTGLSIALVDDQRVVWAEGFGFADKSNKVPARPDTIYRTGSISKLLTATAAMQLVEQGKLDIDKPLQTYLPDFSIKSRFTNSGPITPRNIMTHHSGLPSNRRKGMWTRNPEPFENIVEQIKDEYVANSPDLIFAYSNLGVTLLGDALERVTGQAYASHMDASVLSPLGMTHSSFSQGPEHPSLAAKSYRKGEEVEETALRDLPAGGLNSTVLDLSRFMQMVFAGGRAGENQLIRPETLVEMLRPQNTAPLDLDDRIGLAWRLGGTGIQNAGLVAGHGGATLCQRSQLIVLPEHKLGIVVLANSATAGGVVHKVAEEALKLALESKTGIQQPEEKKTEPPSEVKLTREELLTYEGHYDTVAGVVQVSCKSDHLEVRALNKSLRLIPRADGLFYLQHRLLGLFPISLGGWDNVGLSLATISGRNVLKGRGNGREWLVGERIQPVAIPEKMLRHIGEYQCVNHGSDAPMFDKVCLRQENGLLLMDYSIPLSSRDTMTLALKPVSDSEALIYGLGRGKGETIRLVNEEEEELFRYSGYLFKKKRE